MCDKYDYIAIAIQAHATDWLISQEHLAAYLREQFPEPATRTGIPYPKGTVLPPPRPEEVAIENFLKKPNPVEGVRELVKAIKHFNVTYDEAERLITEFIEKREAGMAHKHCIECEKWEETKLQECKGCITVIRRNWQPLPPAPKE